MKLTNILEVAKSNKLVGNLFKSAVWDLVLYVDSSPDNKHIDELNSLSKRDFKNSIELTDPTIEKTNLRYIWVSKIAKIIAKKSEMKIVLVFETDSGFTEMAFDNTKDLELFTKSLGLRSNYKIEI